MSRADELLRREARYVSPATRLDFSPIVVDSGIGARFVSVDGEEFLDFHSMACVLNTGHRHPRVIEALKRQLDRLVHCNPGYVTHEPMIALAERLGALVPGEGPRRVAFGLSGSDANDGALKLVRAATGRWRVLAFSNAYHGNTYGAMSLSSVTNAMRRGFGPEVPGIHRIPFPDVYRGAGSPHDVAESCLEVIEELFRKAVPAEEVAAVFLEPIQGDSGVLVPPQRYVDGLVRLCAGHGILIVAEEVQTGIGRTGRALASEHFDLTPDVVVLGKALGSGLPVSAIVARSDLMSRWTSPGHAFSAASSPLLCSAALATLDVLEEERLAERAVRLGGLLVDGFKALADRHPEIGDVRGRGLMLGVDLVTDRETRQRHRTFAAAVLAGCLSRGLYLTFLNSNVLRLAPPLTVTEAEVSRALAIFADAFADAAAGRVSQAAITAIKGW